MPSDIRQTVAAEPLESVQTHLGELFAILGVDERLRSQGVVGLQTEASMRHQAYGFEPTGFFPAVRDDALRQVELDCVFTRSDAR